ncbi:MAG: phosphate transport system regulatory protein [Actinomycetota bacterium]
MDELRKGFHHELDEVRAELSRLAAFTIEAISRATGILLEGDLDTANKLIEDDDEIDSRSVDLEERCYQLLALQAPVAGDLRQLVAVVKMIGEIERSADLTVNIAKASRRIYGHDLDPKVRGLIARMGEQAHQLFVAALESFESNDAAKAAALDDMDSFLDGLQRELVRRILETHAESDMDLQVAIQLAMVARFYERIGDHAVNIGERVRYLVDGWMPEHKGAERYKRKKDDTGEHPR